MRERWKWTKSFWASQGLRQLLALSLDPTGCAAPHPVIGSRSMCLPWSASPFDKSWIGCWDTYDHWPPVKNMRNTVLDAPERVCRPGPVLTVLLWNPEIRKTGEGQRRGEIRHKMREELHLLYFGSRTLWPQDISAPRHFGTIFKPNHRWSCDLELSWVQSVPTFRRSDAEVSHTTFFGAELSWDGAEVSHAGPKCLAAEVSCAEVSGNLYFMAQLWNLWEQPGVGHQTMSQNEITCEEKNITNQWQDEQTTQPWWSSVTTVACREVRGLRPDCIDTHGVHWTRCLAAPLYNEHRLHW